MNNNKRRFMFQNGGYYHIFYRDMKVSTYESPHTHTFYQCTIVMKGRITQIQGSNKNYQVAGEVFISPPGYEHSLYTFANDTVYYCLSFSEALLLDALAPFPGIKKDLSNISLNYLLSARSLDIWETVCQTLMKIPESPMPYAKDSGYHFACAAVTAALGDAVMLEEDDGEAGGSRDVEDAMNAVVHYFEQYYYENLNIEDIAEKFGFKRAAFTNHFTKRTGISPKRYITERRIHEAMCLIDSTDLPLNAVAEKAGYGDFSTFYRNFLRMTQMTPSEYRARAKD